jgi:chemotaxis protein methyltransferase CheR
VALGPHAFIRTSDALNQAYLYGRRYTMTPSAVMKNHRLSEYDFNRLTRLIHEYSGITIAPVKQIMLEGRIGRRLNALGLNGFREYCEYLFSSQGMQKELTPMIDAVSTNKTDFFREPAHFDFLREKAVPYLRQTHGAGTTRKFSIWSSACSSGEEPYTMSMVLAEIAATDSRFQYAVYATDISTRVLDIAQTAVYAHEIVEPIPLGLRKKYLLKSRDKKQGLVKIAPMIRDKVSFRKLNLMDATYGMKHLMDVIFCRNVIIYFDRPTQEAIIHKLSNNLIPGGYLIMGHSETLTNMKMPLQYVAASVYQKPMQAVYES